MRLDRGRVEKKSTHLRECLDCAAGKKGKPASTNWLLKMTTILVAYPTGTLPYHLFLSAC